MDKTVYIDIFNTYSLVEKIYISTRAILKGTNFAGNKKNNIIYLNNYVFFFTI